MNIATTKQRILEFIEFKSISKQTFFKETGLKRGFLDADKLHTTIPDTFIANIIATFPELDLGWLVTGKGQMLKEENKVCATVCSEGKQIPFVNIAAVGGFGSADFAIGERDVKAYYVVPKFKDRKIDFMIEITGSSMYPKYNSGDVVACRVIRESGFLQWNKVHVVATKEQGILIKRLKKGSNDDRLLAISDNSDYDPFEIPKNEITGLALVVGVIRLE